MSEHSDPLTQFYELYFKLKKQFPGCCEEYYHRHIREKLGYECPHPFALLRVGGPDGYYYASTVVEAVDSYDHILYLGTQLVFWKPSLWCPCCQRFPWNDEKNEARGIKPVVQVIEDTEIVEKEPILSTFQATDETLPTFEFPDVSDLWPPGWETPVTTEPLSPEHAVNTEVDDTEEDDEDEDEVIRKHFEQEIAAEDAKWAEENAKRLIRKKKKFEMITLAKTVPLKKPPRKV
jgi:hypothetical protein